MESFPKVTLLIAAYNEESIIKRKIENSFKLNYPKEKLQIIVVSDGSTDNTPKIVESFKDKGVLSLFKPPRKGKTAALNHAVGKSNGEVIVFSDANCMYKADAINNLVQNFGDLRIGGVTGKKEVLKNTERAASIGDKMFWNYESYIKKCQSRIGSITTGDGEIFAIRKSLYQDIPEEIINDDTAITFSIIKQGFRVIFEPNAISYEEASISLKDDFSVKARMVSGGFQTLSKFPGVLFPPISFFAVQFISHKILRWTMFIWLFLIFVTNFALTGMFYSVFQILQIGFYMFAIIGWVLNKIEKKNFLFYLPYYYCVVNIAAAKGLWYFLSGKSGVSIWKKASRI